MKGAIGIAGPIDPPGIGLCGWAFDHTLLVGFVIKDRGIYPCLQDDEGVAGLHADPVAIRSEGELPLRGSCFCWAGQYAGFRGIVAVVLSAG